MLTFSTWRATAKIPWVRLNLDGFRYLRTMLYLLCALHRARRLRDFIWALKLFFEMAHSFAQYTRDGALGTIESLLEIPWFARHRRDLLRMVTAYSSIVESTGLRTEPARVVIRRFPQVSETIEEFIRHLKVILRFNEDDERRIGELVADPVAMEEMMAKLVAIAREEAVEVE